MKKKNEEGRRQIRKVPDVVLFAIAGVVTVVDGVVVVIAATPARIVQRKQHTQAVPQTSRRTRRGHGRRLGRNLGHERSGLS